MISRRKFLRGVLGSGALVNPGLNKELLATRFLLGKTALQSEPDWSRANLQRAGKPVSIDRVGLVTRHNPLIAKLDPLSPLTLGNGEFAFTGDITGLRTLPKEYENAMPLCTMSQWGWHTRPAPAGLDTKSLRLTQYDTHGRQVGYQTSSEGQTQLYNWLRENPHRLHLGQIGFCRTGGQKAEIRSGDVSDIKQELDL